MRQFKLTVLFFWLFAPGLLTAQINPNQLNGSNDLKKQMNPVFTAVPFLNITPDSRAGAIGDVGVATTPDANSLHWNPSKYAFIKNNSGISVSYSPWLRNLVGDIDLAYLSAFKRLGKHQTIAASILYFSLGDIEFTDRNNNTLRPGKPNEFSLDIAYARVLGKKLSGGLAFRYIRSDISTGIQVNGVESNAGQSVAADLSFYYQSKLKLFDLNSNIGAGINISNIGTKLTYTDEEKKDFIPTNLRVGFCYSIAMDNFNSISLAADFNKLLVPTRPVYWNNYRGEDSLDIKRNRVIRYGKDPNVSVVKGIFQSFYDSPGGLEEELREVTYGLGLEYLYQKRFAVRGGYFHENRYKGNRVYYTAGLGIKFNVMGIDFSYLIPVNSGNPLANTLRFSIYLDMGNTSKNNNKQ